MNHTQTLLENANAELALAILKNANAELALAIMSGNETRELELRELIAALRIQLEREKSE